MRKTFNWDRLGPKGGKSDALRVLCGLKWDAPHRRRGEDGGAQRVPLSGQVRAAHARSNARRSYGPRGQGTILDQEAEKWCTFQTTTPKAPIDPYSGEGAKLFFQHAAAHEARADRRGSSSSSTTNAPIKWVPDTICTVCERPSARPVSRLPSCFGGCVGALQQVRRQIPHGRACGHVQCEQAV